MVETITYRIVAGCEIRYDFSPSRLSSRAPMVVWIHGGGLMMGNRREVHPVVRGLLADRGFAQASIDYRLAPETKLPDIIDDVREAFRSIRDVLPQRHAVDPERVGVIGGSAGGYLALMSGFAVSPRPQALVSLYGYGNIIGPWYSEPDPFYNLQPPVSEGEARSVVGDGPVSQPRDDGPNRGRFYLWCRQNGRWPREAMGADVEDEQAFLPYSPEQNVDIAYPPTLLIHGDADTDVPYQRSVDMAGALLAAGVEHDLITIEGGEHAFDWTIREETWSVDWKSPAGRALTSATDWLAEHV